MQTLPARGAEPGSGPAASALPSWPPPSAPTSWLAEPGLAHPPPTAIPAAAEVAVVGGGLMGIATAYWLTRAGAEVLLLEARGLAWGATGRNGGLMLAGTGPLEDPALVRAVLRDEAIDADLTQPGHLALAGSEEVWEAVRGEVARRPPGAPPLHALDRAACEELLGMRIGARFRGGRWLPSGGLVHPARFAYGLARAARRRGATLATGARVSQVQAAPGRDGYCVRTIRGSVLARHVVFACNARVAQHVPALRTAITPVRGQVLATQPLPPLFRCGLALDRGAAYWRQASDGTIVLGGLRHHSARGDRGLQERLDRRVQAALEQFLPEAFPGFPPFRVARRWAGVMDATPDGLPLVGPLPGPPGRWAICGFGGHGLPVGLGAGRALAEAIRSGRTPAVLAPCDPGRLSTPEGNEP